MKGFYSTHRFSPYQGEELCVAGALKPLIRFTFPERIAGFEWRGAQEDYSGG